MSDSSWFRGVEQAPLTFSIVVVENERHLTRSPGILCFSPALALGGRSKVRSGGPDPADCGV